MRLNPLYVVLLVLVLTSGQVRAQDSEIITVTGLYVGGFEVEGDNTLSPCHVFELWYVDTDSLAFSALLAAYDGADSTQLSKSGELFVEMRGRYTAYGAEEESHEDGVFEVTEFVRSSTAAADITACEWTCERAYGANSSTCLAQVDGQCGSTRDGCVAGIHFDDDVSFGTMDTTTEYRWVCLGLSGGERSAVCTAPKAGLRETEADESE